MFVNLPVECLLGQYETRTVQPCVVRKKTTCCRKVGRLVTMEMQSRSAAFSVGWISLLFTFTNNVRISFCAVQLVVVTEGCTDWCNYQARTIGSQMIRCSSPAIFEIFFRVFQCSLTNIIIITIIIILVNITIIINILFFKHHCRHLSLSHSTISLHTILIGFLLFLQLFGTQSVTVKEEHMKII